MSFLSKLFGGSGGKEDTEALIEIASNSSGNAKVAAIRSLGSISHDKRVSDFLVAYLRKKFEEYQKDSMSLAGELTCVVAAIEELGRLKDERSAPVLNDWATHGFFTAIISAAETALGKDTPRPEHRHDSLFYAVVFGDIEEVTRLLDAGADVNAVNMWGQTPLDVAYEANNQEIIRLLAERGGRRSA